MRLEFKMGVFLVHPGIAMPNQALPKLGSDAAIRQQGHKSVPQGMKSFVITGNGPFASGLHDALA